MYNTSADMSKPSKQIYVWDINFLSFHTRHHCMLIFVKLLFKNKPKNQLISDLFISHCFSSHMEEIKTGLAIVGNGGGGGGVTRVSRVSVWGSITSRIVGGCSGVGGVSQGGGSDCRGGSVCRRQQGFWLGFRGRNCSGDGQDGEKSKQLKRKW